MNAAVGRTALLACVAAVGLGTLGCTGGGETRPDPSDRSHPDAGWVRSIDTAIETGTVDPAFLARALDHPEPAVRREAARAYGSLGPADAVAELVERWGGETDPEVRTFLLHSLGLLGRPEAVPLLAEVASEDAEPRLRRLATVALGRIEGGEIADEVVEILVARLDDPDARVRGAAALAIWHHEDAAESAIHDLVARLRDADPGVRWRATYALARIDDPATLPPLRDLLGDPHRWVRTFAARGMRSPLDPAAIDGLAALLADRTSPWTARVEALRTITALRLELPETRERTRSILTEHLVRETHPLAEEVLIEALAAGGGELELPFIAAALDRDGHETALRTAIRVLGSVMGGAALERYDRLDDASDPRIRVAVASGLAAVGEAAGPSLAAMLRDEDARVRTAAADSLAGMEVPFRWPLLETALEDPDLAVRTTAVSAFAEVRPEGWVEFLEEAWDRSRDPDSWELRQTVLATLGEHAREAAIPLAEEGLRDAHLTVRLAAAQILERDPPGSEEASPPVGLPFPRLDDPFRPDAPLRARVVTERGVLVLELFLDAAPRHVSSFVALAELGTYDGRPFHRVVPAFVVQGADPREDGWGDAGYHLVDEIHPAEYLRGTVGMPKAGDHTGGAQLFITHLPTPRLDGRYTVFGQVVEGLDVLDRIEVGDRILRVEISGVEVGEGPPRRAAF